MKRTTPLTRADRRFASSFIAGNAGVRTTATRMRGDGRMDAWVWVAAIDTSTMLRLGILIADHIAGGVTDVRLDCTAVESIDDKGFGLLARYANQMRGLPKRRGQSGTLTLENVLPELATAIAARGLGGLLEVQLAFPTIPHSPESFQ